MNRKRFFILLVLAIIVAGGVFAQDVWGGKKNHISGSLNVLGGGFTYERILTPHWSVGGTAYYSTFFIVLTEWGVDAFGRYYIWRGLFTEFGLGFHQHWGKASGSSRRGLFGSSWDIITGAALSPGLGYKFDVGKPGGFFIEPGIKIPVSFGIRGLSGKFGVGVGVVAYVGLGGAF